MSSPPLDFPEIDCLIDDIPPTLPKCRVSSSLDNIRSWTSLPPKRPHRHSCQVNAFEPPRRKSTSSNRRTSVASNRRHRTSSAAAPKKWTTPEQKVREKKRRRTVYIIVGMFLFILVSCVLVVIVTLTHQSEFAKKNSTLTYYTFSPPTDVVHKTTSRTVVRQENEELMNSLEDSTSRDSLHNLTASVPDSL